MARKTVEEQKTELEKRKKQLENRIKALEAKQTMQERKDDTRRKILAGAIVLHHAKLKPDFQKWLADELNRSLDKPHDRALFENWFAEALGTQPAPAKAADEQQAAAELA